MMREIQHLVSQLTGDELREYLIESLFMNTVIYENDRLGAVLKKLPPPDAEPPHANG
jgi:hypothetical protein